MLFPTKGFPVREDQSRGLKNNGDRWLDAMHGEPLRRKVTITNLQGLHLRPITAFVELAGRFQSSVHVSKEGQDRISAKSPLSLLGLGAEQGTDLILEIEGPDQEHAMAALVAFLANLAAEEDGNVPTSKSP